MNQLCRAPFGVEGTQLLVGDLRIWQVDRELGISTNRSDPRDYGLLFLLTLLQVCLNSSSISSCSCSRGASECCCVEPEGCCPCGMAIPAPPALWHWQPLPVCCHSLPLSRSCSGSSVPGGCFKLLQRVQQFLPFAAAVAKRKWLRRKRLGRDAFSIFKGPLSPEGF